MNKNSENITWQLEERVINFTLKLARALRDAALPQALIHRLSCDDVVSCIGRRFPLHHDGRSDGSDQPQEG